MNIFDEGEDEIHFSPLEWIVTVAGLGVAVVITIYLSLGTPR